MPAYRSRIRLPEQITLKKAFACGRAARAFKTTGKSFIVKFATGVVVEEGGEGRLAAGESGRFMARNAGRRVETCCRGCSCQSAGDNGPGYCRYVRHSRGKGRGFDIAEEVPCLGKYTQMLKRNRHHSPAEVRLNVSPRTHGKSPTGTPFDTRHCTKDSSLIAVKGKRPPI